jgi:PAS domain S-box-containing protein
MASSGESGLDARLARVARITPHAVCLLDVLGRIDWVNDGFTAMTGYRPEEARGLTVTALLQGPYTDPDALDAIRENLGAPRGVRAELQLKTKADRPYWADVDAQPTYDADGVHDGFLAITTDITPAKALADRLKASTASLRSAGHLARLGAWEVDLRSRAVRWSSELRAMLGRPGPVETLEDSLAAYHPDERQRVWDCLAEGINSGQRVDFEVRGLSPTGEEIWLRVMGEPEMVDGRCVAMRGASQDITAQRHAHVELALSERFNRGVIDGLAALLIVIDEDGRMIEANKAFRARGAALINSDTYPMGRNLFDVLARLPDSHGRLLTRGIRAVLAGETTSFTRAYRAQDGEWFRLSATRFDGEGPVRCVVFTQSIEDIKRSERRLRDLNQRLQRARDEAHAASNAKSAFLATMSHEIRTPLNGVLGMAQAMNRDDLSPIQRERLTVIRQAGETLLALLNDLLDLSRIEAGKLELEDGTIDLDQMLHGVQATFTTLASEKDVSLSVKLDEAARGVWRGDPTRVRQILYNLVSNAVKFTAAGEVTVKVTFRSPNMVFEVADTGPGIPADRLDALFQKFVQADTSTTRRYGGSGLGLSICRQLSQMMGGKIEVRSTVGVGSIFTVRLPLARSDAPAPRPASEPGGDLDIGREPAAVRILAAEDNPMNQLVLKTLMAQVGVVVECVSDGREAIEAWAGGDWDAILMDVQMPVMGGPEAAREIRAREAREHRRRTPIIALTANAMEHHRVEYIEAGMDALVPKPLEMERLLQALQTVLEPDAEGRREAKG